MNQRAVRSSLTFLIISFFAAALAVGCGGAVDDDGDDYSSEDTSEADDESQTSTDDPEIWATDSDEDLSGTVDEPSEAEGDSEAEDDSDTVTEDANSFLGRSDARALWLWNESPGVQDILEDRGGMQKDLLKFLGKPHKKESRAINRLFFEARGYSNADRFAKLRQVSYDPLLDEKPRKDLRKFIKKAKKSGVSVEFLDGQAIWVASDENAEAAKQVCRDVVAYNKSTSKVDERFDGLHMDIEPHTVRQGPYAGVWWENKLDGGYNAEWTQRWKDILNSCRSTLDDYEAETGHRLTLASDLGTDYSYYNKPIYDFLNRKDGPLDYVSIMNYFDNRPNDQGDPSYFYGDTNGSQIVGGVIENLAAWDKLPVMFAVETGSEVIAEDWQSFHQEGYEAMYDTIDELMEDYASSNTLGVAFHHYGPDSYRNMKP